MCGFVSVDSKRGHVSISWFGHNVQFGFGCVVGQNIFFSTCSHVLGVFEF